MGRDGGVVRGDDDEKSRQSNQDQAEGGSFKELHGCSVAEVSED